MSDREGAALVTTLRRRARHTGDDLWEVAAAEIEQCSNAIAELWDCGIEFIGVSDEVIELAQKKSAERHEAYFQLTED